MIHLIIGGGASGKSEYAEQTVAKYVSGGKKYYLATMIAFGSEGRKRVDKHRVQREGKCFVTLECPYDFKTITGLDRQRDVALLEDVSNLVANIYFGDKNLSGNMEKAFDYIVKQIAYLSDNLSSLVIVTNNVFEDGISYDEDTKEYIKLLGRVNIYLSQISKIVDEVVVGIPVRIKDETN